MNYIPIPITLLAVGSPLPVDVWSGSGQLLLRKGQPIVSVQHRDKLHAHAACSSEVEGLAWQRAYERMVHEMLRNGSDLQSIANAPMPSIILERDYVVGQQLSGGWLDLQEVLRGILYQGGLAINPMPRLLGIEKKFRQLLKENPDDSLFCLFQALADNTLGYCATNALLCAMVCELAAPKLGFTGAQRDSLLSAALTMNIGMARDQDYLARQNHAPDEAQRALITAHPQIGVEILKGFGVDDPDTLDIVRWHHAPTSPEGLNNNLASRRLLKLADEFIARMAGRKSRASQAPVKAVKSMVLGAQGEVVGVGSAMAQAVGFYPPGSYVLLTNGETAISVKRGERANMPWVMPILDKNGLPITKYLCKDTSQPEWEIASAVNFEKVRVAVNLEKLRQARDRIPR